jgi:hypothetical protein
MSVDAPEPQLMVPNPFATAEPQKPHRPLYSPGQIGAAAVVGTFVAGCWLYATNQRRLGQRRGANITLAIGVISTALLIVLPDPAGVAIGRMAHALGVGLWYLAKKEQGSAFDAHLAAGGKRGSNGLVVGITFATFIVVLALGSVAATVSGAPLK